MEPIIGNTEREAVFLTRRVSALLTKRKRKKKKDGKCVFKMISGC